MNPCAPPPAILYLVMLGLVGCVVALCLLILHMSMDTFYEWKNKKHMQARKDNEIKIRDYETKRQLKELTRKNELMEKLLNHYEPLEGWGDE